MAVFVITLAICILSPFAFSFPPVSLGWFVRVPAGLVDVYPTTPDGADAAEGFDGAVRVLRRGEVDKEVVVVSGL